MSDTWTPEQMRQRATTLVESGCYCSEEQCYACITANMLRQAADDRERVTALQREVYEYKEREATVCPEDVGFEEYIKALRERMTAREANLATVDALRQAAEASKVELAGRVTALEAEVARLRLRYGALHAAVHRLGRSDYAAGNQFGDGLEQGHKNAQYIVDAWREDAPDVTEALDRLLKEKSLEAQLATLTAEHARLTARWEALRAWAQARYDETENLDDVANWAYERMMGRMNILERDGDHP